MSSTKSRHWIQTAESVTAGHADKICDLIADAVLDAVLSEDRFARVSCEVMATTGMVIVTGQITTKCYLDISGVVRRTLREVGYNDPTTGFDHQSCAVLVMLEEQSGDVALGVDRKGAGDQGVSVGYATDEGRHLPIDGCRRRPMPLGWFLHPVHRRRHRLLPGLPHLRDRYLERVLNPRRLRHLHRLFP